MTDKTKHPHAELDDTPHQCDCYTRGADSSIKRFVQEVHYILDGKDDGTGYNVEPWGGLRKRLLQLREEDLIIKLKELIGPEPKYKKGQRVWYFDYASFDICNGKIEDIVYKDGNWLAVLEDRMKNQEALHPSRDALIDAQLKYWQSLKDIDNLNPLRVCKKCGGRTAHNHMMLGGNPGCDHEFYEVEF